jgi:hypothetical protein
MVGCASEPTQYTSLGWARSSAAQAEAECTAAVGANPLLSHTNCMRAQGWEER